MKKLLTITAITVFGTGAFAGQSLSDYVVETGTLLISGQAAIDLYEDLEANEKILQSVTRQETREKKTKSIRCVAEYITGLKEDGNEMDEFVLNSADCKIQLPRTQIGPR